MLAQGRVPCGTCQVESDASMGNVGDQGSALITFGSVRFSVATCAPVWQASGAFAKLRRACLVVCQAGGKLWMGI